MRLTLFIITLLLAVDATQPSGPWLVTIAVLSGLTMMGGRERHATSIAIFVIALLMLTDTVEWRDGWFIAMAALAGAGLALKQLDRARGFQRWRRRWIEWSGFD